jgi:hypothetical protein
MVATRRSFGQEDGADGLFFRNSNSELGVSVADLLVAQQRKGTLEQVRGHLQPVFITADPERKTPGSGAEFAVAFPLPSSCLAECLRRL